VSRDEDDLASVQQQHQPAAALTRRHPESGYITPSDQELIIDSIFAPCHGSAVKPVDADDDLVGLSPSLGPYLACVVPPPPSITADDVCGPSHVMNVLDAESLIVPPPPPPPPVEPGAKLSHIGHSTPLTGVKLPPPTMPKHYKTTTSDRDVTAVTSDVTGRRPVDSDSLLNCSDSFPPPPPLDDVDLVSLSSPPRSVDNLPPPPPSVLRGPAIVQRSMSVVDKTSQRGGDGVVERRTSDITGSSSVMSPSSSSDGLTNELAAAMLAARLRAESNQPLTDGQYIHSISLSRHCCHMGTAMKHIVPQTGISRRHL